MMQKTFDNMGLDPILPVATHPMDEFQCGDTGEWKSRDECLFSYDGKAWWWDDERWDYESAALVELAGTLLEGMDDYVDHDDSIEDVKHPAFNMDQTWRECVGDYFREYFGDCAEYQMEMICDDLQDCADGVVKTTGYSDDFDYDLNSWDVGEVHDQVMINDHPLLKALYERNALESMLDDWGSDHEFVRHGKYISGGEYPCLDLMLDSDKSYWWGCSHETMEEVYHKYVD